MPSFATLSLVLICIFLINTRILGLFSSYIPHRVGYQCANFYRYYVLPKGEIVDPNYYFTPDGEVVYVPPKGKTGSIVRVVEEEESSSAANN